MIAEFLIGRRSRANTARAYQKLAPGTHWRWVGRMGVLAGFLILSYYAVVAGWTLEYIFEAATNGFAGKTSGEFISSFQQFSSSPWRPVVWLVAFLLITHFIIVKGVEKGIEKSSKIMMPTLFIIILILVVCSVTLPGAGAGIEFLLKPDFSKVDGNVFLSAMGQAFFSLSLGMGCLCTYASYFSKETNLTKTAFSVGIIDTFVAILAGFIIFPAAFSVGIQPDSGPSLIFITLPNVFQQAFGGVPDISIHILCNVLRIVGDGCFNFYHFLARSSNRLSSRGVQSFPWKSSKVSHRRLCLPRNILFIIIGSDERIHRFRTGNVRSLRLCNS